jgi:hypothetical protein
MLKTRALHLWTLVLSVIFLIGTVALPLWRIVPLSEQEPFIPLHYNIYFGVDRFGPWYGIFWIPALGVLLFFLNLGFQTLHVRHEKHLAVIFAITNVFLQFGLLAAMFLIVLANL